MQYRPGGPSLQLKLCTVIKQRLIRARICTAINFRRVILLLRSFLTLTIQHLILYVLVSHFQCIQRNNLTTLFTNYWCCNYQPKAIDSGSEQSVSAQTIITDTRHPYCYANSIAHQEMKLLEFQYTISFYVFIVRCKVLNLRPSSYVPYLHFQPDSSCGDFLRFQAILLFKHTHHWWVRLYYTMILYQTTSSCCWYYHQYLASKFWKFLTIFMYCNKLLNLMSL